MALLPAKSEGPGVMIAKFLGLVIGFMASGLIVVAWLLWPSNLMVVALILFLLFATFFLILGSLARENRKLQNKNLLRDFGIWFLPGALVGFSLVYASLSLRNPLVIAAFPAILIPIIWFSLRRRPSTGSVVKSA